LRELVKTAGNLVKVSNGRPPATSESSELSAENGFSNVSSNASVTHSQESSHSSSVIAIWPNTQDQTHRVIEDIGIEEKKFQLEGHAVELEASVLNREIELQSEIREMNSEISEL
jgi:hypothetical protein